jgi:hypothetical protein
MYVCMLLASEETSSTAVVQETVSQYAAMVADLERTLPLSSEPSNKAAGPDVLQALPSALSNLHEFFINVAARLDRVHEQLAEGKEAYLAELAAVRILSMSYIDLMT